MSQNVQNTTSEGGRQQQTQAPTMPTGYEGFHRGSDYSMQNQGFVFDDNAGHQLLHGGQGQYPQGGLFYDEEAAQALQHFNQAQTPQAYAHLRQPSVDMHFSQRNASSSGHRGHPQAHQQSPNSETSFSTDGLPQQSPQYGGPAMRGGFPRRQSTQTEYNPFGPVLPYTEGDDYEEEDDEVDEHGEYKQDGSADDSEGDTEDESVAKLAVSHYGSNVENEQASHRLTITSEAAYHAAATQRINSEIANRRNEKDFVDTCPTDPTEIQNLVGLIYEALKFTKDGIIKDKRNKNGRPAQAVNRMAGGFYKTEALEMAAWGIFEDCRVASYGVSLVERHHKGKFESFDVHPTFYDRLNAVIDTIGCSKAACKQVLDAPFRSRLVNAPISELRMKVGNSRINGRRDKQNLAGRVAAKAGLDQDRLDAMAREKAAEDARVKREMEADGVADEIPKSVKKSAKKSAKKEPHSSMPPPKTPTRKRSNVDSATPTSKRRKTPASTPTKIKVEYETPTRTPGSARRLAVRRPSNHQPVRMGNNFGTPVDPALSMGNSFLPPPPEITDTNQHYKELICDTLGVVRDYGDALELGDLRLYAYAYNEDKIGMQWHTHELGRDEYGHGHLVIARSEGAQVSMHLTRFSALQKLEPLARARGDLANMETASPRARAFHGHQLAHEIRQAMGLEPNQFGLWGG
ncbi:hypothetical protein LZ554_003177 [Drepanopeziza brunnea f. sp. 'monogermtubi']|nr:hypothetical protein LZ554_003177 [Drepanopeziza brunnea f. sp. 'monogermtubi']